MKKTAILIMLLTIASKAFGFTRDIVLSYFYGASGISDAYLISITIPTVIFTFVGTGIATTYIPMYSGALEERGIETAERFTNNIINLIFLVSTLISLFVIMLTIPIVKLFASGFVGETLTIAVQFTRVSILCIYFTGMIYIISPYLQLKKNFIVPALMGIPLNIFIIIGIILSANISIRILSIGNIVASAFQLLFLLLFAYRKGYRYTFILDINDKYLKQMLHLALPVIIGVSVNQINVLVDRTIASQVAIGGISALTYANRLNLFIQGIFVMSIATAMYPMISKMAAEKNMDGLKKSVAEAVGSVNLMVVPVTVGSMLFAQPVVKLLFGRGAFDAEAISMTSVALFFYSIGMIGYGLREVISRAFYSLQDTKTPMINAAIALIMNIILNIILSRYMGIGGLALATSISAIFCTVLLFINLRKKIGAFGIKKMSISFGKVLAASLVMGAAAKLAYGILIDNIGPTLSLMLAIGLGAVLYFVLVYVMKVEEVNEILMMVKRKLRKSSEHDIEENLSA